MTIVMLCRVLHPANERYIPRETYTSVKKAPNRESETGRVTYSYRLMMWNCTLKTPWTFCDARHALWCLQDGWSALMYASLDGHTKVLHNLISARANLDIQEKVRGSNVACAGASCNVHIGCCFVGLNIYSYTHILSLGTVIIIACVQPSYPSYTWMCTCV